MVGTIGIHHHEIQCIIGDLPKERTLAQRIYIDLEVGVDFSRCAKSDKLEDSVCYTRLATICSQLAIKNKFRLLETFASAAIARLLQEPGVEWAFIRIKKPDAIDAAQYTYVELRSSVKTDKKEAS